MCVQGNLLPERLCIHVCVPSGAAVSAGQEAERSLAAKGRR